MKAAMSKHSMVQAEAAMKATGKADSMEPWMSMLDSMALSAYSITSRKPNQWGFLLR